MPEKQEAMERPSDSTGDDSGILSLLRRKYHGKQRAHRRRARLNVRHRGKIRPAQDCPELQAASKTTLWGGEGATGAGLQPPFPADRWDKTHSIASP